MEPGLLAYMAMVERMTAGMICLIELNKDEMGCSEWDQVNEFRQLMQGHMVDLMDDFAEHMDT